MALRWGLAKAAGGLDFGIDTTALPLDKADKRCATRSQASGFFMQNIVGCVIMAAIAKHKKALNIYLAAGLSSGLCGSLTTFGTWMQETTVTILNGKLWMALVSLISQLCVALCAYTLGHYLAGGGMRRTLAEEADARALAVGVAAAPQPPPAQAGAGEIAAAVEPELSGDCGGDRGHSSESEEEGESTESANEPFRDGSNVYELGIDQPSAWQEPEVQEQPLTWMEDLAILVVGTVIMAVAVVLMAVRKDAVGLMSLALAPFGALLRWVLSLGNPYTEPFPAFTLVANLLGTAAAGVSAVMMYRYQPNDFGYEAWAAFGSGFGGCLSTVSTFVAELQSHKLGGLRLRSFYATLSIGMAMGVLLPLNAFATCPN